MHKIATCCYCGTRAALVLRGEGRHELSCAACGAPLHDMKAIPQSRSDAATRSSAAGQGTRRRAPGKAPGSRATPAKVAAKPRQRRKLPRYDDDHDDDRRAPRRRKSGSRFLSKAFEEIWDVVEDIFD
ncbi:hypothetical protein [Roseovarius dicentrarchi]|uniref:hypothetical protein n=1 Tax=Roseovarius dicentrarchi TaxID=2250573 RepID=UPI000DEB4C5F|nr:hypothetical protein [Roseovarius dicentrarchi]